MALSSLLLAAAVDLSRRGGTSPVLAARAGLARQIRFLAATAAAVLRTLWDMQQAAAGLASVAATAAMP